MSNDSRGGSNQTSAILYNIFLYKGVLHIDSYTDVSQPFRFVYSVKDPLHAAVSNNQALILHTKRKQYVCLISVIRIEICFCL